VYAELLLVALIWGTGSVAIKIMVEGFPPFTAAALRLLLATAGYAPLLRFSKSVRRPRRGELSLLVWLAISGYLAFNVLYFLALDRTTASHAVLVWGAQPVVTAVLAAIILGERVSRQAAVGVVVSVVGVAVIVASSLRASLAEGADPLGDAMLVGLLLTWVVYSILTRRALRSMSPLASTGYACVIGCALIVPVALATDFRPGVLGDAPLRSWLALGFSGIVSVVFSYILWNRALFKLGATRTSVFVTLSPVWGLLMSWLLGGEAITPIHLVGAALIGGGVLLANAPRRSRPRLAAGRASVSRET
jgi:drug/metabolite transporter (DMT)-like permease